MSREQEELIVYLNGGYVPESLAKVSIYDRCFLYGDGIFDGITVWKWWPFKLESHLKRMFQGLAYLLIDNPFSYEQWEEVILEVIRRNDLKEGYLRPQVSRGQGISAVRWQKDLLKGPPNVVVIPVKGLIYGDAMEQGFTARILSRPRVSSRAIPAGTKHCNYLDSVLGAIEVSAAGMDIGIAVDGQGFVTEGLAYNIFMVKNGEVFTPPLYRDLLPGVTRATLIELYRKEGLVVHESDFDVYALSSADEVFFTSTLRLGGPVVEIDGRTVGDGRPGPVTRLGERLLLAEMDREAEARQVQGRP